MPRSDTAPPAAQNPHHAAREQPLVVHPQLQIIRPPLLSNPFEPAHIEYRVYNYRYLPSGRLVRGDGWGWRWVTLFCAVLWVRYHESWLSETVRLVGYDVQGSGRIVVLALVVIALLAKTRTVLYQSIIPLPDLGLQLSTTRGISLPLPRSFHSRPSTIARNPPKRFLLPISTSSIFIPLSDIATVVINEGIQRWSIVYYLAIVKKRGKAVVVALDEIKTPHAVLREVYHGIRETLFDEYDGSTSDNALHPG